MKKFFVFVAVATLLTTSCKQSSSSGTAQEELAQSCEVGPYTIEEIVPQVYHLQDYNHDNPAGEAFDEQGEKTHFNNCSDLYLLVGTERALLIDLSNFITWHDSAIASLRQAVSERVGDKPLTITFTHNHGDHTGMLPAYVGDTTVFFALPRIDFEPLIDKFPEVHYAFYDEGHQFDLGGMTVSTVMVPGHTHGSMVFFLDGQNIAFTGDAIGSGHGVWIFNTEGFEEYVQAVPHLISYIQDPAHGIDPEKLVFWGGHYWQRDWFADTTSTPIDWQYLQDMQTMIGQIADGTVATEPSNLNFGTLDTYFRLNNAIIVWNKEQAEAYHLNNAK